MCTDICILHTHAYSSSPFIKAYTLISEANHKFISSKVKERRREGAA